MDLVDSLRRALADEPRVTAAWLFGSRARGRARADSDVDVAVWCARPLADPLERFDIADALTERVGAPVDLVLLDASPADLVHRVFRDGVLLIDRDKTARLRMEVQRRNEYFDMAPIWRAVRGLPAGAEP